MKHSFASLPNHCSDHSLPFCFMTFTPSECLCFLLVYQNYIHHFDLGFCFVLRAQVQWLFHCRFLVEIICSFSLWLIVSLPLIFLCGPSAKESICQCRRHKRHGFDPWVGKILWSRKWQPTPAFLPGESHGQRSLVSYSPWGCKESDMTEATEHPSYC